LKKKRYFLKEVCILAQSSSYFSNSIASLSLGVASRLEKQFHGYCMQKDNDLDKVINI
jgi:hypothetical protein